MPKVRLAFPLGPVCRTSSGRGGVPCRYYYIIKDASVSMKPSRPLSPPSFFGADGCDFYIG